jgi:L,D-peptidoglycan transpeptidase YkuD (ErfK/YbiS/YcfS/YnhG family)
MKRYIFFVVLALSFFLLAACGHMELTYKETPAVSASVSLDNPTPELSPQEADSPAPPVSAPAALEGGASPEVSVQPPPAVTSANAQNGEPAEVEDTASPAAVIESPAPAVEPSQGQAEAQGSEGQPPFLTQAVSTAGLSFDVFDFSQLVLVAADGSTADIYCYDKGADGLWTLNESIGHVSGYSGRNGVSTDKHEGDGCSPGGLFKLGYAFGNNPEPPTGIDYRAITSETYWVDDPESEYYNQWVEGTDGADWTGGEHLSDNIVSYAYAIVIEYNTPPSTVAGKGSAIFLHIGNKPTSGCVTVTEETLLRILKWLSADKNPSILITVK